MKHWWLLACMLAACHSSAGAPASPMDAGAAGTPVQLASVARATLEQTVSGPGHTDALEQQKVRAPFDGTLLSMSVQNGDHVKAGQVLGEVVSQNSEATLVGARAMLKAARTAEERSDAARAVELAERELVKTPLRAPEAGVVVAHSADEGALVTMHEDIVSLAAADSIVFVAEIVQTELPRIHPGQKATIQLAALAQPIAGVVHVILPAASPKDLTSPVRIDFAPSKAPTAVGLFGAAHVVVGVHPHAQVVPEAAVLRDDVTGVSRVATVGADQTAHWVAVTTGLHDSGRIEIVAPPLGDGTRVIVAGQVGLPDGAKVAPE